MSHFFLLYYERIVEDVYPRWGWASARVEGEAVGLSRLGWYSFLLGVEDPSD